MSVRYETTFGRLIIEAQGLVDPSEAPPVEYARGMCELIARCFPDEGVPTDERADEIAAILGLTIRGN